MNTHSAIKSVSLFYREGSSDKVYHASIEPKDGGFVVNFAYGRRGSSLQTGTKTQSPVSVEVATRVFDKIVAEKASKGYTPEESGVAFAGTEKSGRVSGYLPQLLNEVSLEEAERLILDPAYLAQEKFYGERRLATTEGGSPQGMNRKGLFVPLMVGIAESLANSLISPATLDGEEKGERLYVFDLLKYGEDDLRGLPLDARIARLEADVRPNETILIVPTARTTAEKRALFDRVKAASGEGVVFKRKDAPYTPGRPNSGGAWLKFKFKEMASFVVLAQNLQRSVEIAVHTLSGLRSVGNVTIPPSSSVPSVGAVVEVQYLYAMPNGGLLEPVYLGERGDVEHSECSEMQLKFKRAG